MHKVLHFRNKSQADSPIAVRCHGRNINIPGCNHLSITSDFIAHSEVIPYVSEIQIIVQRQNSVCPIIVSDPYRAVDVLEFKKSCVWSAVRIHQTIHTEVAVVDSLTAVSTVGVHILAVCRLAPVYGVVAPLPHKTATGGLVAVEELEVVLQISRAVAHGMAVFAQDVRFVAITIYILSHLGYGWIHSAVEIQITVIVFSLAVCILGTLVVCETGAVIGLDPSKSLLKCHAVCTLISHGPDDYAGTVLVPDDTAPDAVKNGFTEFRVVGYRLIPPCCLVVPIVIRIEQFTWTMCLYVGLVYHIESVFVAELIEIRHIWIVTGSDGIDIVLLHERHIPDDLFSADGKSCHRVGVVPVHSVKLDRHTIDIHNLILYGYLPDSYPVSDDLSGASDDDSVEEWSFCIPQNRRVNR
ncbi:uncharacterized protein BN751_01858 [Coprococcus eutactus CAG:665]|nr:uncharacterized protein BN751_01858 [Coprococcus eutactus CAG:665]